MVDLDRLGNQEHDPHRPTDWAASSEQNGTHNDTASNSLRPREIRQIAHNHPLGNAQCPKSSSSASWTVVGSEVNDGAERTRAPAALGLC